MVLAHEKKCACKDFHAQHGFSLETENGEGSRWTFDLQQQSIACPEWIKLNTLTGVPN
jgi:hypothetical protein